MASLLTGKVKSYAVDIVSDQLKARIKQVIISKNDTEEIAVAKGEGVEFAFLLAEGNWFELARLANGHVQRGAVLSPKDALGKWLNAHR